MAGAGHTASMLTNVDVSPRLSIPTGVEQNSEAKCIREEVRRCALAPFKDGSTHHCAVHPGGSTGVCDMASAIYEVKL